MLLAIFAQGVDTSPLPNPQLTNGKLHSFLDIVFAIVGAIALLVITLAGSRIVASRGNPQAIAQARNAVIYAAVGLVVDIMAFTIVTFVLNGV